MVTGRRWDEKNKVHFCEAQKELDKIIGNCKYGRLVFNKCGNDIYGILMNMMIQIRLMGSHIVI